MAQQRTADPTYVMGRISTETRRLIVQARIFDGLIRRFLADAGTGAGITRLKSGFGSDDVTRATAYLVSPTGRVIGIDINPAIIETAEASARAEQRDTGVFVAGVCRTTRLTDDGGTAVDQFVLIYTSDTSATMQAVVDRVNQGSVVAFTEAGFGTILDSMQAGPGGVYRSAWQ